jgi:SAM-dependent methyltransferase
VNLFYLVHKRDPNVVTSEHVSIGSRRMGADTWRGLQIAPGEAPQVRVRAATSWHPFRTRPASIGWYAATDGPAGEIRVAFAVPGSDQPIGGWAELALGEGLAEVRMPWPLDGRAYADGLDLILYVPPSSSPVFLACHRALDRRRALELCVGTGVEIGPGPKPQILPSPQVQVSYLEEMPPQEWRRLYGPHYKIEVDEALWERYCVGRAHELPVPDASLDFIFSSHVFEHLANPLGHLRVWASKLRRGGKVVAVVPDLAGTKDYPAAPTPLHELLAEFKAGAMEPSRAHYERFARVRGIQDGGEKLWASRSSIHVHFYTHSNMAELMGEAVRRLGYQGFAIMHTPNHKDFYVVAVR